MATIGADASRALLRAARTRVSGAICGWLTLVLLAAPGAMAQDQTVVAGATTQVTLPASEIAVTCTPPAWFVPNPTEWTVSPPTVTLGGTVDGLPAPGQAISVTVPADHPPSQMIFIAWNGSTACESYGGSLSLQVTASSAPGASDPVAAPPLQTPAPDASGKVDCGPISAGGQQLRLIVRGLSCQDARDILDGTSTSWECWGPEIAPGAQLLCRSTTTADRANRTWAFGLPRSGARCRPVEVRGRWWDVYKDKVTCGFARNTARRALTGQHPIIDELTKPSEGRNRRWGCRTFGHAAGRYGLCHKIIEDRYVAWMPSERGA